MKVDSTLQKRYFPDHEAQPTQNMKGDTRDFMSEVISTALHQHHPKPDKWMDFFDNGAKWGHFMTPQLHHPSTTTIHDQHYTAKLSYNDPYEETNRIAASQESHVEAYPGELVSGENSLSKFIAPPVFDEPSDSVNRDKINSKKESHLVNTPEAVATETSNTKKLVDSLNSFMTPLKVPSEESDSETHTKEPLGESSNWNNPTAQTSERGQINDKQIKTIIDSEKVPQGEPGTRQFENSLHDMLHHDSSTGHADLERQSHNTNNNDNEEQYFQDSHVSREYDQKEGTYIHDKSNFVRDKNMGDEDRFEEDEPRDHHDLTPEHYTDSAPFRRHDHDDYSPRDNEDLNSHEISDIRSRDSFDSEDNRNRGNQYEHFMRNGDESYIDSHNHEDSRDLNARPRDEMREPEHDPGNSDYDANNKEPVLSTGDEPVPDLSSVAISEKPKPVELMQDDSGFLKSIRNTASSEASLSHSNGVSEASLLPKVSGFKEGRSSLKLH